MNRLLTRLTWLLALAVAFFGMSAIASAEPVAFNFDQAIINLGGGSGPQGAKLIDPDADPADAPATLRAEVDTSPDALTASATDFVFPQKSLSVSGTTAVVSISATGAISGTFDVDTGATDVNIPVQVSVTAAGTTCTTNFPLDLKSTGTLSENGNDHAAAPFDPDSGEGAVYSTFTVPATTPSGVICGIVDGQIGGDQHRHFRRRLGPQHPVLGHLPAPGDPPLPRDERQP